MDIKDFTKSIARSKVATIREIDEDSGLGLARTGRIVLILGDDKSIAEFTKQFHESRGILL